MKNTLTYQQLKALQLFLSDDPCREACQDICINHEYGMAYATNGRMLLAIKAEFSFSFRIRKDTVKLLMKNRLKGCDVLAFVEHANHSMIDAVALSDKVPPERTLSFDFNREITYPSVQQILERLYPDEKQEPMQFNTAYLEACAQAYHYLEFAVLKFTAKGNNCAFPYLTSNSGAEAFLLEDNYIIVLLPLRTNLVSKTRVDVTNFLSTQTTL